MTATKSVLEAVARRLEEDPEHILATLRLLGDLDAVPETDDARSLGLARTLNAQRLAERRRTFRQHSLTTNQIREILGGITRQAVADRVKVGGLLKLDIAGRSYFPDWQRARSGPPALRWSIQTEVSTRITRDRCGASGGRSALARSHRVLPGDAHFPPG